MSAKALVEPLNPISQIPRPYTQNSYNNYHRSACLGRHVLDGQEGVLDNDRRDALRVGRSDVQRDRAAQRLAQHRHLRLAGEAEG